MNKKALAVGAAFVLAVSVLFLLRPSGNDAPPAPPGSVSSGQTVQPEPAETADPIPPRVPRPAPPPKNTTPEKPATAGSATVYRVDASGERARLVPIKIPLPAGKEPMAAALNALARVKDSPLPPGTQARSVGTMGNGTVHVDFNQAFQSNFPGGNEEEALTLGAVTGTLAHFPGVERVLITVNGKKIDSLGGHESLREPLPVRGDDEDNAAQSAAAPAETAP